VELAIAVRLAWSMRGVCDSTSPVKAKVIAVGDDAVVGVVETSVVVEVEVEVEVEHPAAMHAKANNHRLCFTQPIYCSAITALRSC
jgi:hypothetical protein